MNIVLSSANKRKFSLFVERGRSLIYNINTIKIDPVALHS